MIRLLYRCLLRLHPRRFRRRFGEEMLSVFDQAEGKWSAGYLLADACLSLARQWTLRPDFQAPVLASSIGGHLPDGTPVFYTFGSSLPRRGALMNGLVLSVGVFAAVFLMIGQGRTHRLLIGSHHPSHSHLLPATPSPAAPQTELSTEISIKADGGIRNHSPLRDLIAAYFRIVLPLDALDTNHDFVISAAEIANAPEALRKLDTNHDRKLTAEECGLSFGSPARSRGPSADDLVNDLMTFDRNGDGRLQRSELSPRMQGLFDRGDLDGDGALTAAEIRRLAQGLGAGPAARLDPEFVKRARLEFMRAQPVLAALDADHDGEISASEMQNAAAALLRLDRNHDGQLSALEVLPDPVTNQVTLILRLDINADGKISIEERANGADQHYRGLLDSADRNKDGVVTARELTDEVRRRSDLDGDGVVSWEEMLDAVKSRAIGRLELAPASR